MHVADTPRPKGYYFLTPVWGAPYVKLFMDVAIPAQLALGNLPVFKNDSYSRYVIFTRPEDEASIREASIFKKLSETITVIIEYIDETITIPHDLMSACHKRGIAMADEAEAAALFLNPDLVFADGSFRKVKELAEQSTDVILTTGIRTLKQGVLPALKSYFAEDGILTVHTQELMRIALDHLHPLADSSWWEEKEESDLIPANLYWRAGNEGIVARCFHLHPLMVYPQRKGAVFFGTVDDDYVAAACPDASHDYVITDSDELLAIELSDPARAFLTGFRKQSIDDCTVWAEQFTNARHRRFFDVVILMHAGIKDYSAWQEATEKSHKVVKTIKSRLKIPTLKLFFTHNPALQRRMIRWSQDYELQRVNDLIFLPSIGTVQHKILSLHESFAHNKSAALWHIHEFFFKTKSAICALPAHAFLTYVQWVRNFSAVLRFCKHKMYGTNCSPRPWTWRYRYIIKSQKIFKRSLRGCDTNVLVLTYDPAQSCIFNILGKDIPCGLWIRQDGTVRIINRLTSQEIEDASYETIVVERGLSHIKQSGALIAELARILKPKGRLIALINRVPTPSDRIECELCVTSVEAKHLLTPEFTVISQEKQGAFAQGLMHYILDWAKMQSTRVRLPFLLRAPVSILLAPFNIVLAIIANIVSFILDRMDTTERYYISSITTAIKADIRHDK